MADKTFPHPGLPDVDGARKKTRDELDGTFSDTMRSRLEGWDAVNGAWIKMSVTTAGVLSGLSSSGGVASLVDQGAPGLLAWKVDGSAVTQPVAGPLTDAQLRATSVPVSGPLTDTQLRASAVPVSGTFYQATQPVSLDATQQAALAQDATLGGGAKPNAYTLADRLYQIAQKLDKQGTVLATEATLQKVLAAATPPKAKPYTTLLHRG